MDKIELLSYVALIILIIGLSIWIIQNSIESKIDLGKCEVIVGCEKYKCFADADLYRYGEQNYLLEYQACLIKEIVEK